MSVCVELGSSSLPLVVHDGGFSKICSDEKTILSLERCFTHTVGDPLFIMTTVSPVFPIAPAAPVAPASAVVAEKAVKPDISSYSSVTFKVPTFIQMPYILAPLKLDITYRGARLVDTLTWDLYNPVMLPEEFAAHMCADLNLPPGMQERIALQLREQIESYQEVIDTVYKYAHTIPHWERKISQIQVITIGIRHGTMDYCDKIEWDPMMENFTPEDFAATTCADLGLPGEMEPAIAHKIRETLFRWLITLLQNPLYEELALKQEFQVNESKVSLVPGSQMVDMISNLWKRAKPNTIDESAAVPQPQLPAQKECNADIWERVKNAVRKENTTYGRLSSNQLSTLGSTTTTQTSVPTGPSAAQAPATK